METFVSISPGLAATTENPPVHDIVLRDGAIYDGSGNAPISGEIAVDGDRIVRLSIYLSGVRFGFERLDGWMWVRLWAAAEAN